MEFNFTKCKGLHIGRISCRRQYEMKGHKLGESMLKENALKCMQIEIKFK